MASAKTKAAPQQITDRIKTWEDVLGANNLTQEEFDKQWAGRPDYDIATEQTRLIALALNEGTVMKTADTSQYKYYPWHLVNPDSSKPSGFGLSYDDCDRTSTGASRGARLCFKTWQLAEYAGKQFVEIYERASV